jgi:hypothetical protein
MDRALELLQHTGVASINMRWSRYGMAVPGMPLDPEPLDPSQVVDPSFVPGWGVRDDVFVVTVASQSHIEVWHLAQSRVSRLSCIISA